MQLSIRRGLRLRCHCRLHSPSPEQRLCTGRSRLGSFSALAEGFVETSFFKWAQICWKHLGDFCRSCVEMYCGKSPVQAPWRLWWDGWVQFSSPPLVGAFSRIFPIQKFQTNLSWTTHVVLYPLMKNKQTLKIEKKIRCIPQSIPIWMGGQPQAWVSSVSSLVQI